MKISARLLQIPIWAILGLCLGLGTPFDKAFCADPVSITLLHTNDLHAHFRPEKTPLALGGIARLKTMVDRLRAQVPNPIFVDGGDWSEGDIYYTQGTGSEVLKMMDLLGYDISVVGNHDWLNGPDSLLDAIEAAQPKMQLIVANFDTSQYPRASEFNQRIKPYVIRNVQGVKVAFIGLATYEFIYDKYIEPIQIEEPFDLTKKLAHQLKQVADAVVVISHNSISYNEDLLRAAPDVDLVIGAHDHVKLTRPIVVNRIGAQPGWVVETGCWGRYLGRVDMRVYPRTATSPSQVKLLNYGLIQLDRSVPEDPVINARLDFLEKEISARMGPIFTDHIGKTDVELDNSASESRMGNFTADAYRAETGADVALDMKYFVYGEIHEGVVNSVDVYDSNPAVFNPSTQKTWTLKTVEMSGRTLSGLLNMLLFRKFPLSGALYTSGLSVRFNGEAKPANPITTDVSEPATDTFTFSSQMLSTAALPLRASLPYAMMDASQGPIEQILIDGAPIDPDRQYLVAAGGGVFQTIEGLNELIPGLIPVSEFRDTGHEAWRAMVDFLRTITPVSASSVPLDPRLQSEQADLGMSYDDVSWTPIRKDGKTVTAKISVQIHNYGATASPSGPFLLLQANQNGNDLSLEAHYAPLAQQIAIDSLQPGESRTYEQVVELQADRGVYSIVAMIRGNPNESNHSNDDVLRYFSLNAPIISR